MLTFGISCGGHDPFRSFSLYVILIETMEIGDPFCNLCTIFNQLPLFLLAQWSLKRHVPKQFGGPRQMRLWLSDKSIIYLSSFRIQSPPNHEEHSSVFFFFRRSGHLGHLTCTSTNHFPGAVKNRPSTPRLGDLQEIIFLRANPKNRTLVNCI